MTVLSDAQLLELAGQGDQDALAELYVRHRPAARRVAGGCRHSDPDDLVNEAFEKVFAAVRRQAGPTEAFRAYLFVTIRRLAARQSARDYDDPYDEVPEPVLHAAQSGEMEPGEREMVTAAFSTLPERWQAVLWHTAVEGRQPREVADNLGMSSNAVSALAYRAREKLRQAYLQAHLRAAPHPECEPHRSTLGAYVRNGLGRRDHATTHRHIQRCDSCRTLLGELADVNHLLAHAVLPMFLVTGIGEAVPVGAPTGTALLGEAMAGEATAGTGRRLLGLLPETAGTGQAVSGVAAVTLALLVAVGTTGSSLLLDREAPEPDLLEAFPTVGDIPISSPTGDDHLAMAPPDTDDLPLPPTPLHDCHVAELPSSDDRVGDDDDADTADDLLALPIGLVLTLDTALLDDVPLSTGITDSLVHTLDGILCARDDTGDVVVTLGAIDPEQTAQAGTPAEPPIAVETEVSVDLGEVAPEITAGLSVQVDDDTRVELNTNLAELCAHEADARTVVCTLDSTLGGTVSGVLSDTGLSLDLQALGDNILTVELADGDVVVESRLLSLLP